MCAAVFEPISVSSFGPGGPANYFILGTPFIAKFPATFLGPGAGPATPARMAPAHLLRVGRLLRTCMLLAACSRLPRLCPGGRAAAAKVEEEALTPGCSCAEGRPLRVLQASSTRRSRAAWRPSSRVRRPKASQAACSRKFASTALSRRAPPTTMLGLPALQSPAGSLKPDCQP